MQERPDLPQRLRALATELAAWEVEDHEALKGFTTAMHGILPQVPERPSGFRALMRLALEGLQSLSSCSREHRQGLTDAIVGALGASERFLVLDGPSDPLAIQAAAHELLQALGRSPQEWTSETEMPTQDPADDFSLDDAAALLMQLSPFEVDDLSRIRDALLDFAAATHRHPAETLRLASEAAKKLEQIIQGKTSDPDSALTEAGWLIEGAAEARASAPGNVEGSPAASEAAATPSASSTPHLLPEHPDVELVGDFITECREYIEQAEAALLALELEPADLESVNTVFRAFHTIKGTAAFLDLTLISEFAHHAESLLSRMRDGEIRCTGGYADLALRAVDMMKELIVALQDALGGDHGGIPRTYQALLRTLRNPEAAGVSEEEVDTSLPRLGDILVARGNVSRQEVEDAATRPPRLGDILVAEGKISREDVEAAASMQGHIPLGVALMRTGSVALPDVARALRIQRRMSRRDPPVEASVRVRTDRLDRLIDMIGELVIAHTMVAQDEVVQQRNHHDLHKKVGHTGKIVRELQDLSLAMRMVPFRATFQKMARVVRDVAQKRGKAVQFVSHGEETEIDRNMVDVIADPLVHMIRNAVDHGLEPPDEREQRGKPRTGTVWLSAYHVSSHVVVELRDDGRGLDRDRIVDKAIHLGLIDSGKGLADHEVYNLLFEPGFSTAEEVTEVSGRGVGMDVVKRNIEALKGRIEIASEPGLGTTFTLRLPLTLAITDGMLVRVGSERYIIPTAHIALSLRPEPQAVCRVAQHGELVRLRDELIPLLRLHRLFALRGATEAPTQGILVVLDEGERRWALLVDELLGQQQVVAKSLGGGIGPVPGISGAAILGDGRVGLILDPAGLVALARQMGADAATRPVAPPAA